LEFSIIDPAGYTGDFVDGEIIETLTFTITDEIPTSADWTETLENIDSIESKNLAQFGCLGI